MASRELIVNADEFGLTEGVNHGIVEVHRQGIVTSTTMVANEHAFEHAIELSKQVPELAIGVHLNVTHGSPVLPEVRVYSLVDDEGIRMAKEHGTYFVMDIYNDDYILNEAPKFGLTKEKYDKEKALGQFQR